MHKYMSTLTSTSMSLKVIKIRFVALIFTRRDLRFFYLSSVFSVVLLSVLTVKVNIVRRLKKSI